MIENYPAKRDSMAALSAARNVLLLDSRLRGNDEANGLFWFKNSELKPIRTVLGLNSKIGCLTPGTVISAKILVGSIVVDGRGAITCTHITSF